MAYRELITVATGVKGQIEACISALDLHESAPDEIEQITDLLVQAANICDTIVQKGNDEPETPPKNDAAQGQPEQPAKTEQPAGSDAATVAANEADALKGVPNIFDDPAA